MSDDLERRVAEALWPYVRDDCMSQGTAERLAAKFAAALRATATRGVFAGRETMVLLDIAGFVSEWPADERAKQDAEAAGLAALEGTDDV